MSEPSPTEADNLALARRYLAALAQGATGEALEAFLHPDIVQQEFPSRLNPQGARSDRATMLARAERGARLLSAQRFELRRALAQGDSVALEVDWSGTLAVPLGSLPAGHELRARFAMFLQLEGGRIIAQNNYDCFEAF
jgi:ketosteroid isomerase-like protein